MIGSRARKLIEGAKKRGYGSQTRDREPPTAEAYRGETFAMLPPS